MFVDERACTTDAGPMCSVTSVRQLALAFILLSGLAGAQPTYRQSTCVGPSIGTRLESSFPNPPLPGSLIVVGVTVKSLTAHITVSDSLGNTYQPVSPPTLGVVDHQMQVWFTNNRSEGLDNTITVSIGTDALMILYLHEYGGFSPAAGVEAVATNTGETGLEMPSGPLTTTTAPVLLFSYAISHGQAMSPPPDFSARLGCSGDVSSDLVVDVPGTWNAVPLQMEDGGFISTLVAFASTSALDGGALLPDGGPAERDGGTGSNDGGVATADGGDASYRFIPYACSTSPTLLARRRSGRRRRRAPSRGKSRGTRRSQVAGSASASRTRQHPRCRRPHR
jgi:hypothetical protein